MITIEIDNSKLIKQLYEVKIFIKYNEITVTEQLVPIRQVELSPLKIAYKSEDTESSEYNSGAYNFKKDVTITKSEKDIRYYYVDDTSGLLKTAPIVNRSNVGYHENSAFETRGGYNREKQLSDKGLTITYYFNNEDIKNQYLENIETFKKENCVKLDKLEIDFLKAEAKYNNLKRKLGK